MISGRSRLDFLRRFRRKLFPAAAAEMATATGFYYSKAKAENKIKLMKSNGIKPKEEHFGDISQDI